MRDASQQRPQPGGFDPNGRSLSQIIQEVISHVSEIFRSELKLARTEIQQELAQMARASVFFAAGGMLTLYSVGFLFLAAVYGLQLIVAPWLAAVIVGVFLILISAVLFLTGRSMAKKMKLRPEATIRSFEENLTWLKKQAKS